MHAGMGGICGYKTIYHILLSGHKLLTIFPYMKYAYSYPSTCESLIQILYQILKVTS